MNARIFSKKWTSTQFYMVTKPDEMWKTALHSAFYSKSKCQNLFNYRDMQL